ncbi:MAG: hypothetical protein COA45_08125 [Zetaproteobacteria bacterium]|nr:MAG: hypothetical protein COA45_08125 [Zetaproteobacteria bacterium]
MLNLDISAGQTVQVQKCAHGFAAFDAKSYDDAISLFNESLEACPSKDAYFGLAKAYNAQGELVKSVKNLTKALELDPAAHDVLCFMGDIYCALSQGTPAIESYAQAVAYDPSVETYKQRLVNVVGTLKFKKMSPNLRGVLLECLESDGVDFPHFGLAWLSIFSSNASLSPLYKLSKHSNYGSFKKGMDAFANYDALIEPFFLTGLGKFIVPDVGFERWVMHLRRYFLEAVSAGRTVFSDPEDIELMTCALSKYHSLTRYISSISEDELSLVEALKQKVVATDTPALSDLALLGCYEEIYLLSNAAAIATKLQGGDHVSQIPKSQIEDYFARVEIKKNVPVLTTVQDTMSLAVQAQYEEFPYSYWDMPSKDTFNENIEGHLKGQEADILIAGCGTGKEAVQLAYIFPDAHIVAIDLSLDSLAYAIHKARQFGIENIKFKQADIMELGTIEERFDYIVSPGALHHLSDPKSGWAILSGLLKPNGLMRVSLYSQISRWAVNEARSSIRDKNIGSDVQSVQNFRADITDHMKYKSIKELEDFIDFYALAECNDLLFHVHEHQFDLSEIKNILNDIELEFVQFHLSPKVLGKYKRRHSDDPNATDLDTWARWEMKNKDVFIPMYNFWCKKNAA